MLLVETTISELVEYVNLWNREYALNMVFHGQYGKHAAWTAGNVLITGTEIAPGRVLCEFDNFDLQGANDVARRVTHRLVGLLHEGFSVDDTPSASHVYGIMARQAARALRVIPAVFADTSLDAETEADFKAYTREKNPEVTEEELSGMWQHFCQLVEQQGTKREEQERRRTMTAEDAVAAWLRKIAEDETDHYPSREPTGGKGGSMTRTILVLAANPKDTSRLRLDQEVREIDNGLQRARRRDEFALKQVWAARPVDIRRAMLDLKPNIVHFCGHGVGDDGIALEDEAGNAKLVDSEVLAGFFELFADRVECVVLNACYSETQAEAIARHIEYVIGMKKGVQDAAAIEFAVAFYDALGAGESVEFAYKLACNAIQWAGLPGHLTPVLKTHSEVSRFLNKVYDSQREQDFDQWSVFSSVRGFEDRIRLLNRTLDGATTFEIRASSTEAVGVNKSLPMLYGRVEFEYKVVLSEATQPNVYFCMIPMQETGIGRTGLIEVGANAQADPKNPYSPYRKRFYVPMEHYGDGQWHQAGISFDFRQTPTAFYCIFAPRINQGCSDPAPAHLLTTNLQVFSSE